MTSEGIQKHTVAVRLPEHGHHLSVPHPVHVYPVLAPVASVFGYPQQIQESEHASSVSRQIVEQDVEQSLIQFVDHFRGQHPAVRPVDPD